MTAAPITSDEFAALMEPLGPFERAPRVAVAVSGGSDSLALCLLAQDWAAERGGEAVGLTVDHRLRPESLAEAVRVGGWLAGLGIPHRILAWTGPKPSTGLQAAARKARYDLLQDWCGEAGLLHLLLAHHREDQAETLLLRLARGSGADGLSGMAPVSALPGLQLLRPLLGTPRARLADTLTARGQPWIEDPSNRNPLFHRVRMRRLLPPLAAEGLDPRRLAATAAGLARVRQALESATAELLVAAVRLDRRGFARLQPRRLCAAPPEISLRAVAGLCRTIGGGTYPPRLERLQRLHRELLAGLTGRRTFGGCVLAPAGDEVMVYREAAAIGPPQSLCTDAPVLWDGRFTLAVSGRGAGMVRQLGSDGWQAIRGEVDAAGLPPAILRTLPALFDDRGIFSVPHLKYQSGEHAEMRIRHIAFTPATPLAGAAVALCGASLALS